MAHVTVSTLGVLVACLSTAALPPAQSGAADWQQYYPLAVGNSWTYKVWEEGKKSSTVEWRVTQVMRKAEGDVFVIWPSPPIDDESIMLAMFKDGLRVWDFGDGLGFYELRFPIREGDSWSEDFHSDRKDRKVTSFARVLSVGKPCTSGEYEFHDCVIVEENNEDLSLRITTTYARNVGRVKVEYYRLDSAKAAEKPFGVLTLTSYKLSPRRVAPTDK